jgi:hypothetical protein
MGARVSSATGGSWEHEHTRQSRDDYERAQRDGQPIEGTPAARYLIEQRKLQEPFWGELRYLPNVRTAEGALVAPLSVDGTVVGYQATFLDPDGRKSAIDPARQTWKMDEKPSPNAVFALPLRGSDPDEIMICDGLEDALAVALATFGRPRNRVLGLPGQWALKHLSFPEGTKITIVADGDPPGSQGAKWLQQGLDHLILSGLEVLVTPIPPPRNPKLDANQLLIEAGISGLRNWLDQAEAAPLSLDGEIERLARLSDTDYEIEREKVRDTLRSRGIKIRLGFLDNKVRQARERMKAAQSSSGRDWTDVEDEEVDLREVLEASLRRRSAMSWPLNPPSPPWRYGALSPIWCTTNGSGSGAPPAWRFRRGRMVAGSPCCSRSSRISCTTRALRRRSPRQPCCARSG